jgi:hypothetical protein
MLLFKGSLTTNSWENFMFFVCLSDDSTSDFTLYLMNARYRFPYSKKEPGKEGNKWNENGKAYYP